MPIAKKYLHDKLMLLLASSNIFLAFLCGVLVFLRIGGSDGYIVGYRPNLGIGAFTTGTAADVLSFAVFAGIVAVVSIMLSVRVYRVRRMLSALVLGSGIIILLLTIIVSNALMVLR